MNDSTFQTQILRRSDVDKQTITDHATDISEARDKLLAILKLILNNDSLAADYLLLNLISRVHTRKDGLILGNFGINLSNVSPQ